MSVRLSHRDEVSSKQFVLREGSMGAPFDTLVNLHIENLFLKPISLALADYPDLFWHSTMVATGYENLIQRLGGVGGVRVLNSHNSALQQRNSGAFLHDIGKLGVINKSIESSLRIMDWVPNKFDKSESQTDGRVPEIRAIQHLHPLVGYEMIIQLIGNNLIPRERGMEIAEQILNHHKTDGIFKTSYPNGKLILDGRDQIQVAGEFLTQIVDVGVAMLSDRPYRKRLSLEIIRIELAKYLDNEKLLNFIFPVFEISSINILRAQIYHQTLATLKQLEPFINSEPSKLVALISNYQSAISNEGIDLQTLINQVWETKHLEFTEEYQRGLDGEYVHEGR